MLHLVGFFCMNCTVMHGSTNIKFIVHRLHKCDCGITVFSQCNYGHAFSQLYVLHVLRVTATDTNTINSCCLCMPTAELRNPASSCSDTLHYRLQQVKTIYKPFL
jgi:hypothetical protein